MNVIAIKMRIRPPRRRTPAQKLKSRLYYRKNRTKIRTQRRRYLRKHRSVLRHRKLFKRFKPYWFKKAPKPKVHKPPKIKMFKPPTIPHKKRPD